MDEQRQSQIDKSGASWGGMGEPAQAVADLDTDDDTDIERQRKSWAVRRSRSITTVRSSKRPNLKLEQYTGSEDWEEFVSHFELCAELGEWSQRDKLLALAGSLRGAARTFYTSFVPAERECYDVLVERLGQRFGNARQQSKWLSRLEARKRGPGESISALGDDLRQMAQRAYPDLDLRAQEVLAINQLYKTVTLEVKCRCMDKECHTISEAIDVIERYESIMGKDEKKTTVRAVAGQPDQSPDAAAGNTAKVERSLQQIVQRLERLEKSNRPSNDRSNDRGRPNDGGRPKCYQCGAETHFIRDCPDRQRRPADNRNRQPAGGRAQAENIRPLMS
jgi:hypothetical protein